MKYFDDNDFKKCKKNWGDLIGVIENVTNILASNDFSQPLKPYLEFKNPDNRIIAMPARVGGDVDACGIKWIASFPSNIYNNLPRANSVTILNSTSTGVPYAIFNTTLLSIIRTSAVTGLIIKRYIEAKKEKANVCIIGFGPIGKMHYNMFNTFFKKNIKSIKVYDINEVIDIDSNFQVEKSWQDAYKGADIIITATASKERYIDIKPKNGALFANISLRDCKSDIYRYVKNGIIVDDWQEVCRKNTDIELFHKEKKLQKKDVYTIKDVIDGKVFNLNKPCFMFNPMGMSSYDIGIAKYFYDKFLDKKLGKNI